MQKSNQLRKGIFTLFLVWTFFTGGLPANGQDIVTSDDISGGSSVFVFRNSRKVAQSKAAFSGGTRVKRSTTQRATTRQTIRKQAVTIAKEKPKRTKTKEQAPSVLATINLKIIPKEKASEIFAGVAEYYLERDDLDKSIEAFRESTKLDPSNTQARFGLSDALAIKGARLIEEEKTNEAKAMYEEAISINDKNAIAYAGLGEIFDEAGDTKKARENYARALDLDKDLTELYAPLGIAYYQEGVIDKADELLTKALEVNPNNAETQLFLGLIRSRQNNTTDAIEAFRNSIRLDPKSAEVHYYLGEVLDRKDDKEATEQYLMATKLNPNYVEAWFDLGASYYNRGNYKEAIAAYEQAKKLKNDSFQTWANLADVYRQLNDFSKATGEYRTASYFINDKNVDLSPEEKSDFFSKYGFVAGRDGKWTTSIEALNKAVALSPNHTDYTNLGWAYYNRAQEELRNKKENEAKASLREAKSALQKAVQMNPKFVAQYLNLGITLNDLGEYKEALDVLKKGEDLREDWVPLINEIGMSYRYLGDLENAAKHFRQAVKLDKTFAAGYYNLGEAEFRLQHPNESKKALEELKKINTPFARFYASRLALLLSGVANN